MSSNCDKGVFEVEDLIIHFKNHACCKANCVVNVCGLPDNTGNYCGSCYPKQSFCCISKSSNHTHSSETIQKKKFYDFVEANRAGWSRYYKNKNDTRSVESEKKSQLFKELKVYLLNKSELVNGNWKWDNSYKLRLDNGDEFPVCRMAWCSVMGISINLIERAQRSIRESNGKSAFVGSRDGADDIIDAKQSFFHFGIDIEGAHSYIGSLINMDEVPDTEGALVLVCWLSSYFDLIGEEQPGANVIHYDPIPLRDIWEQYAHDRTVLDITADILQYSRFCDIIKDVFPKVRPREYKSVSGKCDICEKLRAALKECTLKSDRITLMRYRLFHRNKYMGEKIKYYQRIQEAQTSNGRIWSFIFDGMSKDKTRLPILSNLDQLDQKFNNNVMGCIFHNAKRTQLYVSGPSVPVGSSYMIHCLHLEIKRCLDSGLPLPEKIYLQVDGASDNTAYCVYAAIEHLVGAGLCPIIEVWRLPVGHTHEDIDGRFGTLSNKIKEDSVEHPRKFFAFAKEAFLRDSCDITYVVAIFDYKSFYDKFVDKWLMMRKENYTQLGMIFQKLNDKQKVDNPHLIEVFVNYKKLAQDVGVDLQDIDPLYNESTDSLVEFYAPVIIKTAWMPQEAYYEKDRALGISIMSEWPIGTPKVMKLAPWAADYVHFMRLMKKRYPTGAHNHIFDEWNSFLTDYMPTKPNVTPAQPSDDVADYITKVGNCFELPLNKYLYGLNPKGFEDFSRFNDQFVSESLTSTLDTSFCGEYSGKSTWVDDYVKTVIDQHYQTMPHRNNKEPFKHWQFDFPEICQMVMVTIKKLNSETRKYDDVEVSGRIVSKFVDDIDCGTMYRVSITNDVATDRKKFVDISAEKDYYVCRFKYLQNNPNDKSTLDVSHDKKKKAADLKEKRLRLKAVKNNVALVPLVNVINHHSAVAIMSNDADGNSLKKRALSRVNNFVATLSVIQELELTPIIDNSLSSSSSSSSASLSSSLPVQNSNLHPTNIKPRVNNKRVTRKTIAIVSDIVNPGVGISGIENLSTSNVNFMSSSVTVDDALLQPHNESAVHKVYARSGRQIRSFRDEEASCECGCNKKYDRNTIVYCKGGTRIEKNTGCKKMLNMKCCSQWMCYDCQWATNNGN